MDFHLTYVNHSDTDLDEFPSYERLESNFSFSNETPWPVVMEKFVRFLGACYGYDIADQVTFKSYTERYDQLTETYPDLIEDEEDPRDSQGREFN